MSEAGRPRRADAVHNRAAILSAAATVLRDDPQAGLLQIASRAGVSRRTLYMHFATRAELIDELVARTVVEATEHLEAVDLDAPPRVALEDLVRSSWQVVDSVRVLLGVAEAELSPDRIRDHNAIPLHRVTELVERGQALGEFRADLSAPWLTSMFFATIHTAAAEVRAGRLHERKAADTVLRTVMSLFTGDRE